MRIPGRVSNGVVVLEGGQFLPEGAQVIVTLKHVESTEAPRAEEQVRFPIVRSQHPGSVKLTGQMVAEYLEDEDLSTGR